MASSKTLLFLEFIFRIYFQAFVDSGHNAGLAPAGRDKYRLCCAGQQKDLDLTV